jgi:hypothetical protein
MNKVKYRIHLRAPPKGLAIRAVDRELELGQGGPFALLGKKTKRRALKPSGTWPRTLNLGGLGPDPILPMMWHSGRI